MHSPAAIKRIVLAGLLAIALPAAADSACAPPGPAMHPGYHEPINPPPHGQPMPTYLHGLNLSEAQEDRLFDIFDDQAKYVRERMRSIDKTDKALMEMRFSPDYDETRIRELIEQNVQARAQLLLLQIRTDHLIYSLLTPEQRKQAGTLPMRRPPMPPVPNRPVPMPRPNSAD